FLTKLGQAIAGSGPGQLSHSLVTFIAFNYWTYALGAPRGPMCSIQVSNPQFGLIIADLQMMTASYPAL
ncbi:hypothetical protein FRB99_004725, partial [Tulasnella sp. 403]